MSQSKPVGLKTLQRLSVIRPLKQPVRLQAYEAGQVERLVQTHNEYSAYLDTQMTEALARLGQAEREIAYRSELLSLSLDQLKPLARAVEASGQTNPALLGLIKDIEEFLRHEDAENEQ